MLANQPNFEMVCRNVQQGSLCSLTIPLPPTIQPKSKAGSAKIFKIKN